MSRLKTYRQNPDLLDMLKSVNSRLGVMETGRRLGSSSVDNGTLVIRNGDLSIRDEQDNERIKLTHGEEPSMLFRAADATDSVRARSVAFSGSSGNTSFQTYIVRDSDGAGDGGKLLMTREYVFLSHQPASGEETYIGLSASGSYPNHFLFRGKWMSDDQYSSWNALYMGTIDVVAGFGGVIWNYDWTYPAVPLLTYSITGADATFYHCIKSSTASGFEIRWGDALAHTVNFQVWRR